MALFRADFERYFCLKTSKKTTSKRRGINPRNPKIFAVNLQAKITLNVPKTLTIKALTEIKTIE